MLPHMATDGVSTCIRRLHPVGARPRIRPAVVCAALGLGAAVLMAAPVQVTQASQSQARSVRWAADPVVPVAGAASPVQAVAAPAPALRALRHSSPTAREITVPMMRRAARTRIGGRLGP